MSEPCTVYNERGIVARKPHRCQECGGLIGRGEGHVYGSGVFEGQGFSRRVCSDCSELMNGLNHGRDMEDSIPFEGLITDILESGNTVAAIRMVENMRRRESKWKMDSLLKMAGDEDLDLAPPFGPDHPFEISRDQVGL